MLGMRERAFECGIPCIRLYYDGAGFSHIIMRKGEIFSEEQINNSLEAAIQEKHLKK